VAKKETGKEVWESLKARFMGTDRVRDARLQTLKSEFDAMTMKGDEALDQYARRLTGMLVKYNNLGGAWRMQRWSRSCLIPCRNNSSRSWLGLSNFAI
jgi:hypothetical protein